MEILEVLDIISYKYVVIVVLLIEGLKQYMPAIMDTLHAKWIILVMATLVAVAMGYYEVKVIKSERVHEELTRMFISFLFTISFYSLIAKPLILTLRGRFDTSKDRNNDRDTDSQSNSY